VRDVESCSLRGICGCDGAGIGGEWHPGDVIITQVFSYHPSIRSVCCGSLGRVVETVATRKWPA
jgi:hypothetical protein